MSANFINEVKAQKQKFEIPVEKGKINQISKKEIEILKPAVSGIETKKEIVPVLVVNPEIEKEKAAIQKKETDKNKLIRNGFRTDYYETYVQAAERYGFDWHILAAVHKVETGQSGDTMRKSSCGATGPMQFMPGTFRGNATDGDGDGVARIDDVHDAIFSAAKYLSSNNAGNDINNALFRYNHSQSYVNKVKSLAKQIS